MPEKTNVERLRDANAIASDAHLSQAHQDILNNDFTAEEIDAIIKLKDKITGMPFASDPDSTGGAML